MTDVDLQRRLKSAANKLLRFKLVPLEELGLLPTGIPLPTYQLYLAHDGERGGRLYYTGDVADEFVILKGSEQPEAPMGKRAGVGSFVLDFGKGERGVFTLSVIRSGSTVSEVLKLSETDYNFSWGIMRV